MDTVPSGKRDATEPAEEGSLVQIIGRDWWQAARKGHTDTCIIHFCNHVPLLKLWHQRGWRALAFSQYSSILLSGLPSRRKLFRHNFFIIARP